MTVVDPALAPLLSPLLSKKTQSTAPAESGDQNLSSKSLLGPATLSNLLPIRSPGLAVGDTADSQLNPETLARLAQGNPRPFFLIGSDAVSVQWLATHHDTLKALGAVGMLVQADTEADVRRVAEVAGGLIHHPGLRERSGRRTGYSSLPGIDYP